MDQLPVIALRMTSFLAAPPTPPPGKGPEWGKAAPIGLLVILLLCVGVWLLLRSMNKHLRKVRDMAENDQVARQRAQQQAEEERAAVATVGAPDAADPLVDGPADDDRSAAADPPV